MTSLFSGFRSSRRAASSDSPSAGLSEMSVNSPSLRVRKSSSMISKDSNKGSPYNHNSRRSQRLLSSSSPACDDGRALLSPGRAHSASFVADKHVIMKKPVEGKVGMKFRDCKDLGGHGVLLTGIEPGSVAASSTLLVGDIIMSIDGTATDTSELAARLVGDAKPGSTLFILVAGGTREVILDKRQGDCGMTCAAALHVKRGVLLKRIAKGSLADKAKLYPGDTIVGVNGKLVNHHSEAVSAIDEVRDLVRLVVLGESTELLIAPKGPKDKSPLGLTLSSHESASDGAGVKIVSVVPDGRAAQAGLTAGDTLLSVAGILCTDHIQAIGLLETNACGTDFELAAKPIPVVIQSKYSMCF